MPSGDGVTGTAMASRSMRRANFRAENDFSSPKDLKAIIAGRSDDVSRNLVEKLLAYALGRRLEGYDEIVVDNLMQ